MAEGDAEPCDEVGAWAQEKHARLRKYIDASRAARRKFTAGLGGASYIDLYCGSGCAVLRDSGQRIDGSPLVAFKEAARGGVPFSEVHLADISAAKSLSARRRIEALGGAATAYTGEAETVVGEVVSRLNPKGLHFAFLDPFNLLDLPFSVLTTLTRVERIDLLIHVSAQDLRRNLEIYVAEGDNRLDRFAPGWRSSIDLRQTPAKVRADLLAYWTGCLKELRMPVAEHAEMVTGPGNQQLYWLMFASRSKLAMRLWNDIRSVSGQKDLFPGA
jgi:three-Cys-motif partner protein